MNEGMKQSVNESMYAWMSECVASMCVGAAKRSNRPSAGDAMDHILQVQSAEWPNAGAAVFKNWPSS